MVDNSWAFELGNTIFYVVKSRAEPILQKKFPDVYITDEGETNQKPIFPTVYIHELPGLEQGQTLDGQTINAVLETIQVDISSNTSGSDVRLVTTTVANVFKELRFDAVGIPTYGKSDGIYTSTMRFRRLYGANDKIL